MARLSLLRRRPLGVVLAMCLALAVLLHRPILHSAMGLWLRHTASRQGLSFQGAISGNPLSEWIVKDLNLKPSGHHHQVVDSIQIQTLELHYSLSSWLLHGFTTCVKGVTVADTQVNLHLDVNRDETGPPNTPESVPKPFLALQSVLSLPIFADHPIRITNLNIDITRHQQVYVSLHGGELTFAPNSQGKLRVDALQLPGRTESLHLEATTDCSNHRLNIRGLRLGPDLEITSLELDASERVHGDATLRFDVHSGNGTLHADIRAGRKDDPCIVKLESSQFLLKPIAQFLGLSWEQLPEQLSVQAHGQGLPNSPPSWEIQWEAKCQQPLPSNAMATLQLAGGISKGHLTLNLIDARSSNSHMSGTGSFQLHSNTKGRVDATGEAALQLECGNVADWLPESLRPQSSRGTAGTATGSLHVHLKPAAIQLECKAEVLNLQSERLKTDRCVIESTWVAPPNFLRHPESIAGNASVTLTNPSFEGPEFRVTLTDATTAISITEGVLRFWNLNLRDSKNVITGDVALPLTALAVPPRSSLEFNLQDLEKAATAWKGYGLSGKLVGKISAGLEDGELKGTCTASGSGLAWGGFNVGQLRFKAESGGSNLTIEELALMWSAQEWIQSSGSVTFTKSHQYEVDARAQLPQLEKMAPLFRQLGWTTGIKGGLEGHWKGQGDWKLMIGTGEWALKMRDAVLGQVRVSSLECNGRYEPGLLVTEPIRIFTQTTRLTAQVAWSENTLRIENIALEQWGTPTLSGYLILPLARDALGTRWVEDARLAGQLRAEKLDIANLFTGAGKPAPLSGTVHCSVALSGTPVEPTAAFNLTAKNLSAAAVPKFSPLEINLKGTYSDGALRSEGTLNSPLNAPVVMQSKVQLPLAEMF